jgi:UDP-N-acetylglucosamine 4,6-dehydratase
MTRFWITLDQGVRFVINALRDMHGGEVFVPKIPSMKISDLAEAVAPGCDTVQVGIRPGEKLHEVLLSEDESRHAVELPGMFVVRPMHPFWSVENWRNGHKLPEAFRYTSDGNTQWLTVEELRALALEKKEPEPLLACAAGQVQ